MGIDVNDGVCVDNPSAFRFLANRNNKQTDPPDITGQIARSARALLRNEGILETPVHRKMLLVPFTTRQWPLSPGNVGRSPFTCRTKTTLFFVFLVLHLMDVPTYFCLS